MRRAVDILGLTWTDLEAAVEGMGRGRGAAADIYRAAFAEGRFDPASHGLSAGAVSAWQASFGLTLPKVLSTTPESSGQGADTIKAVVGFADGLEVECVRIPMGDGKFTLCVSSQVGCKMGCTFCETGRMGLLRNLTAAEIVSQLVVARTVLGWPINNVVFMGMGEPLDNAANVVQALRVMNDRRGPNVGQQRITVCTVGRPDGLRMLAELGWKRLNVSLSLNGGTDEVRARTMPINRKTPLEEVKRALLEYRRRPNFVFGINYCLLPGINDRPADAESVRAFCAPLGRVMVNVIPYNPGHQPLTRAPTESEIEAFMARLEEEGLPVRRRATKGRSVMAACGQLGNVELRSRRARASARTSGTDG